MLTTTILTMKDVVELFKEKGSNVKVMISGAPVTRSYADKFEADEYAPEAASAVNDAKTLLGIVS